MLRTPEEDACVGDLAKLCPVETVTLSRGKIRQGRDLASAVVLGKSFVVSRDYRQEMQRTVDAAIESFQPDVVHIDHLQMAQFVDFGGPRKTVLDHHNVESMIIERVAANGESAAMRAYAAVEWPKLRRYELDACRKCDLVITVSEEDKAKLQEFDHSLDNISSVPIGVDVARFSKVDRIIGSRNLLSIGTMDRLAKCRFDALLPPRDFPHGARGDARLHTNHRGPAPGDLDKGSGGRPGCGGNRICGRRARDCEGLRSVHRSASLWQRRPRQTSECHGDGATHSLDIYRSRGAKRSIRGAPDDRR